MVPTKRSLFFADGRPSQVWFAVVGLGSLGVTWWALNPTLELFTDWPQLARFVLLLVLAGAGSLCAGLLVGWPIIGPLRLDQSYRNGAPFEVGDVVEILAKEHRGRVGRVYAKWQGDSVRVELGVPLKDQFDDVFFWDQLLRRSPRR